MRIAIEVPGSWLFSTTYPVLIGDINAGHHLAADRVLPIAIETQMRLFRQLGLVEGLSDGRLGGACYIMADAGLVFRSEARYGDVLTVRAGLGDVGRCSVDLIYQLENQATGVVVALVKTAVLFLDPDTRRPAPVPEVLLACCRGEPPA